MMVPIVGRSADLRQLSSKYRKLLITVKPALNYAGLDPDIEIIDLYSWLTN